MSPQIDLETLKLHPLRAFSDDSSKADYGKLLVVGGSARLPGAILLCARAALRSGCGTVRVAVPASIATTLGVAIPELMLLPLPETPDGTIAREALQVLAAQWKACDASVLGPGLDEDEESDTQRFVREYATECPLPLVLDASAMKPASACPQAGPRVWTPHDGEMQALIEHDFEPGERESIAREWASIQGGVCVLKGRQTLIADASGQTFRNLAGTRGMGTAGSGDVLSGVIGALLAQKHDAITAAIHGVYLHALAGEDAARIRGDDGLMASDFLERLPFVIRDLKRALRR